MKTLTLGSLFDGSGGFPLGGELCGIKTLWASEVEPFPIRVTTKRMPWIKHLGDVSVLNGLQIHPVDIITFGSPCQDLSIAGKRAGIHEGVRSNLFYQAIRIIKEMRCTTNGTNPRFAVWENVPGAFSSNGGDDFKAVLEAFASVKEQVIIPKPPKGKWQSAGLILGDGYSIAWRVLDAQYWGVPQRRKRIYLVADFDGVCAGKILFESESVSRYPRPSSSSWKETPRTTSQGSNAPVTMCLNDQGGNRMDVTDGVTSTLRAESHHPPIVFENHSQDTRYTQLGETAPTVLSTYGTGGNNQPFVLETPKTLKIRSGCDGGGKGPLVQENLSATLATNNDQTLFVPTAFGVCAKESNSMKSDNPTSGFYEAHTARTLDSNGGNPTCNQGGIAVLEGNGSRPSHQGDGYKISDVMYTLNTIEQHAVCYEQQAYDKYQENEVSAAIRASGGVYGGGSECLTLTPPMIVRRLTPTECARLQGFPDWWCADLGTLLPKEKDLAFWDEVFKTHQKILGKEKTKTKKQLIKWLQNPHSDSAEYKMWGNGVALPCVCFVLAGIKHFALLED